MDKLVHAHDWLAVESDIRYRDEYGGEFVIDYYRCECGAAGRVVTPRAEYDKGNRTLGIESLEGKEERRTKAVERFVARNFIDIAKARADALKAYGIPSTMYVGDIFPKDPLDILAITPMNVDTGCRVFGMRIVADFRIPKNKFYITYGDLSYGRSE